MSKRNDLIRKQPSLGETLASKGIEEGTRGFFQWLSNRRGKKKLEERVTLIERRMVSMSNLIADAYDDADTRLKAIETALKEREAKDEKQT